MPGRRRHLPSACTISLLMVNGLSIALAYVVVALQYSRPDGAKVMVTYDGAWALGIAMMLYLAQDCCRSARGRCHLYQFPPTWACPWARSVHLQLAERQRPLACGAPKANIRQPAIIFQHHYVNLRPPPIRTAVCSP